jgi:hypothetical protein
MPSASVRVCVVALTCGQSASIAPLELNNLVAAARLEYDVQTKGAVYGDSPDDWAPFVKGKKILHYLTDAQFDVNSLSAQLANASNPAVLDALVRQVDLYIFDPLFLSLDTLYPGLVTRFETVIRDRAKPFCILLPDHLPTAIRQRLADLCDAKLPLLRLAADEEGHGEWEADTPRRLLRFLNGIRHELAKRALPPSTMIEFAAQVLERLGAPRVELDGSPKLGAVRA